MSELQWSEVKRLLPPALRARVDNRGDAYRQFIEAVFWVARGNAPWASIPESAAGLMLLPRETCADGPDLPRMIHSVTFDRCDNHSRLR